MEESTLHLLGLWDTHGYIFKPGSLLALNGTLYPSLDHSGSIWSCAPDRIGLVKCRVLRL